MPGLLKHREKLNLTQEELSAKSGISVRTIQRIEAGMAPKGYTLRALAKALGVEEKEIGEKEEPEVPGLQALKLINLSSLLFMFLPPLNIVVPLALMYYKKEKTDGAKQIISLQVAWTALSAILVVASGIVRESYLHMEQLTMLVIILALLANIYIIIRNTISIEREQKLCITMGFSFL